MTDALLAWFDRVARELPWRGTPRDPYRTLVSELMLQQTQVDRVRPRFEAFVDRFPTLAALAGAEEDDVLAAWSGLGYYRRARLLHQAARQAHAHGGLPRTATELAGLPGVGEYTAAAVASLAFGEAAPVVDGNVLRVGARVLGLAGDPRRAEGRRAVRAWVRSLFELSPAAPDRTPGRVNEALMELGATVCRPLAPRCGDCPLSRDCAARARGDAASGPPPRRSRAPEDHRWVAACVMDSAGRWLVRRVERGPILRGLWLPPFADLTEDADVAAAARALAGVAVGDAIVGPPVKHAITHRRIEVTPVRLEGGGVAPAGSRWWTPGSRELPTSSLLAKLVGALGARTA